MRIAGHAVSSFTTKQVRPHTYTKNQCQTEPGTCTNVHFRVSTNGPLNFERKLVATVTPIQFTTERGPELYDIAASILGSPIYAADFNHFLFAVKTMTA